MELRLWYHNVDCLLYQSFPLSYILISFSLLRLRFSSDPVATGFPTNILYAVLIACIRAASHNPGFDHFYIWLRTHIVKHLSVHFSSFSCYLISFRSIPSPQDSVLKQLNACLSFRRRGQVSHPLRTYLKIAVLYTFVFRFWYDTTRQEGLSCMAASIATFNLYLIFLWMQFWFVTVIAKYFDFAGWKIAFKLTYHASSTLRNRVPYLKPWTESLNSDNDSFERYLVGTSSCFHIGSTHQYALFPAAAVDIPTLSTCRRFVNGCWTTLLSFGLQKAWTKPTPVLISFSSWRGGIFVHGLEPSHIPSCVTARSGLCFAAHDQSQRQAGNSAKDWDGRLEGSCTEQQRFRRYRFL